MFTRGGILIRNPYLRFVTDGDNAGGGSGDGADGAGADNEPKFPANTPVKDMTPEQQAAYHQHQSRKHENRAKAFGDWTPEKIRALEAERDQLRTKGQTDADKALDAAREEGRAEVRAELNRERATNALDKALTGRTADASALLGLNVAQFIVNGNVDKDAIQAWVEANSTAAGTAQQQKKNPDSGQGHRGTAGGSDKSVSAGRDLFAERHKKSTTTSS